jgi:hypothetical protein
VTASLLHTVDHGTRVSPEIIRYGRNLGPFFVVDGNIWVCSNGLWHPSAFKGHAETYLLSTIDVFVVTQTKTVILMFNSVCLTYSLLIIISHPLAYEDGTDMVFRNVGY